MNFDTKISYDTLGNKRMTLTLENASGTLNLTPEEIPILLAVLKDVNSTVKANTK